MDQTVWLMKAKNGLSRLQALLVSLVHHEYTPRGLALLFITALCMGALVKSIVHDTLTIGYDDYTLSRDPTILDLNVIQKQLIRSGGSLATDSQDIPRGPSCSEEQP